MRAAGFTLIELMVALAVVAVVGATVYLRGGETIAQLHTIERRTLAHMVAQNEIQRAHLAQRRARATRPAGVGAAQRRVTLAGRDWMVQTTPYQTDHPTLQRVRFDVSAIEGEQTVGPVERVTAFIGRH